MVRTILTSDQNELLIKLPDDLVGKRIEVIAFEIEEDENLSENKERPKPSQLRGFLSKESAKAWHDHLNQSRSEWDTL